MSDADKDNPDKVMSKLFVITLVSTVVFVGIAFGFVVSNITL